MTHDAFVTDEARKDIRAIELHVASRGARGNFDAFVDSFAEAIDTLKDNPQAYGLSYLPELANMGFRRFRTGSHLALHRIAGQAVYVAHVVHEAQDYARLI